MNHAPLKRSTKPLARNVPLRSTIAPQTRTPLTRTRRTNGIAYKPRRQPLHNVFPMTCPPGFHKHVMERAGRRCEHCYGPYGLTLSHLVAAGRRAPFTDWNILALCMGPQARGNPGFTERYGGCHDQAEARPDWAIRHGLRVPGSFERRGLLWVYVGPDEQFAAVVTEALEVAQ